MKILFAMLLLMGGSQASWSQLYNRDLDLKAQQAKQLADQIASGSIFKSELDNLDELSRASYARQFAAARRSMRASIDAWRKWSDITMFLDELDAELKAPSIVTEGTEADLNRAGAHATREAQELKKRIADMLKESKTTSDELASLSGVLDHLGDVGDVVENATGLPDLPGLDDRKKQALSEIGSYLKKLGSIYSDFKTSSAALPSTAEAKLLASRLEMLKLREDHFKALAGFVARREAELSDVVMTLRQCRRFVSGFAQDANIEEDLDRAAKSAGAPAGDTRMADDRLRTMMSALYMAAALASHGLTPVRMAELREAEEEHRYAIRRSAAAARSYEAVLGSGVDRLSRYYKSGIRPEVLAQFIHALATIGLIPAVALK